MKKKPDENQNPFEQRNQEHNELKLLLEEYPVWQVDTRSYAKRMQGEMNAKPNNEFWLPLEWFHLSLWRTGLAVSMTVLIAAFIYWYSIPTIPSFYEIQWTAENSLTSVDVDESWQSKLNSGWQVTVPEDIHAVVYLVDDSVLQCSPQTTFRLDFDMGRNIYVQQGTVEINAAHDEGNPMHVHTPLNTIEVVGTHFIVEVLPEKEAIGAKNE